LMRVHAVLTTFFIVFLAVSAQAQRGGGGGGGRGGGGRGGGGFAIADATPSNSGAWWTDQAFVTRLGLTDDQKTMVERAFATHRNNLEATRSTLSREEAQLATLLDAETRDRGGITAQISKVAQARADMERVNALMTLEMRAALTRGQWVQVQSQQSGNAFGAGQPGGGPGAGIGGGRGDGIRGQQ
jgi:Spy/CpxP family protein refolding chaperone